MIFFSIASWNNGGGGRSTARKRKGDTTVLISALEIIIIVANGSLEIHASIDVETGFLIFPCVGANEYLLGFYSEFALKGGEHDTLMQHVSPIDQQ
jgi:hypothetical protein